MIMTGSPIAAGEANANGLVADVFDDGAVLDKTLAVAETLSNSSGVALYFAKEAICGGELCRPFFFFFSPTVHVSTCLSVLPGWSDLDLSLVSWRHITTSHC